MDGSALYAAFFVALSLDRQQIAKIKISGSCLNARDVVEKRMSMSTTVFPDPSWINLKIENLMFVDPVLIASRQPVKKVDELFIFKITM